MIKRMTLYPVPKDGDVFHHRFEDELWAAMIALPGCTKCRVTIPLAVNVGRPYHVIAEAYFADAAALEAAFDSPYGSRVVALEAEISTGGQPLHDACVEHEATGAFGDG
jgi:uncharacterized protein (TIGR02118 family)